MNAQEFKSVVSEYFPEGVVVHDYSCGREVNFVGCSAKNSDTFYKSISYTGDIDCDQIQGWRWQEGFLRGFGKSLESAASKFKENLAGLALPDKEKKDIAHYSAILF